MTVKLSSGEEKLVSLISLCGSVHLEFKLELI